MQLIPLTAAAAASAALVAAGTRDSLHNMPHGLRRQHHSGIVKRANQTGQAHAASKNGLAWPNGPWVNIQPYKKTMSWMYSWDATPATGQPEAADFVPDEIAFFPMLWSNDAHRISVWEKHVLNDRSAKQNKAKVAMGPNEVNQAGQGEMSPEDACDLFEQYLVPLKDQSGWKIIGASTNGAANGLDWTKEFKSLCPDVYQKIDFDSVHFYGTDPAKAIAYFEKWHETFGKPLYITETACMNYDGSADPNLGQAYAFVKQVNDWAQKTSWVKGLAFYGVMEKLNINSVNRLATSGGQPTNLFQYWVENTKTGPSTSSDSGSDDEDDDSSEEDDSVSHSNAGNDDDESDENDSIISQVSGWILGNLPKPN